MKNGLKPLKKDHRDYSFHRTFGGVTPLSLPAEFSVDAGFGFPDQVADGLFEACTAYAQLELCTVQDGVFYNDYETLYRQTLAFEDAPFGEGCDIRDSLKALLVYGPQTKQVGDVDGFQKRRGAFYAVESSKFSWFESIQSVMYTNFMINRIKCAVTIGTPWFKEFDITSVSSNGLVPEIFTGDPKSISWHNWAIVSWKVINGQTYLLAKTWQGEKVGDGGWYYFSKATINAVMKIKGTGAFTVAPYDPANTQTVRLGLIEFLLSFFRQLLKAKPAVVITSTPVIPPENLPTESQKLYDLSYSFIGKHLTMDPTVPAMYGCAEALSYVLSVFGYLFPKKGLPSTTLMYSWLQKNCTEVVSPEVGDIIISVSYSGIPGARGHCGIVGHKAIMSNDSSTGLWQPYWSLAGWVTHYETQLQMKTHYFRL